MFCLLSGVSAPQRTPGTHLELKQLENTFHREQEGGSVRECYKESIIGFGLWLGNLGEDLRKQEFP